MADGTLPTKRITLALIYRRHITANPGCTHADLYPLTTETKRKADACIRKLRKRGLVALDPATGALTVLRETQGPGKLPPGEARRRKIERTRQWREAKRAERAATAPPKPPRPCKPLPEPPTYQARWRAVNRGLTDVVREAPEVRKPGESETVEQWMARTGNTPTVLPGFVHQPDLRRRGQQHFRQGGAA